MFSTAARLVAPCAMPGPATTSGTRMSVSNAVILPGFSRYSPMWYPLSELNTTSVSRAMPALVSAARNCPIIRSTACTAWTRLRKAVSIAAFSAAVSSVREASHGGAFFGSVSNAGPRGAVSPGNELASRGAGVYGACGANVAISSRNGDFAAAESAMNLTPLPASTSVR